MDSSSKSSASRWRWPSGPTVNSAAPQTTTASLLHALRGSRAQARAELTAHLDAGAAELQRLLGLLAHRNELARPEDRGPARG